MQGPSPQGATAKGTKSPPRTKSFGAVPIGGRSKWAGTGTWASRLAHPSCTIGADLEREDQGSDCERMPKKATSEKKRREEATAQEKDARTQPPGIHAAILAASHAPTASLWVYSLSFPSPPSRLTRASASEGSIACPERNQRVAHLVVSRGKDAKKKLPFGTRVILLPVQTFPTTTRPTECTLACCCQTPRHTASSGSARQSQETVILTALVTVHAHGFGSSPLTQPTELLVITLGSRRGHARGSIVPPESAGKRIQAGDIPSRCAGCRLTDDGGGMATARCLHLSAPHCDILAL